MFAPKPATALHLAEHIQIEQLDVHSLHAFQLFLLQSQKRLSSVIRLEKG
ncbi:hypothetical protein [Bacillus mycoides]|nr:hypothetical protein [Bacillus mycoides]